MLLLDWTDTSCVSVTGHCAPHRCPHPWEVMARVLGPAWPHTLGSSSHILRLFQASPLLGSIPPVPMELMTSGSHGPRTAPNHHTICVDSFLWVASGSPHCVIVLDKVILRPVWVYPRRYGCQGPISGHVSPLV